MLDCDITVFDVYKIASVHQSTEVHGAGSTLRQGTGYIEVRELSGAEFALDLHLTPNVHEHLMQLFFSHYRFPPLVETV